MIFFNVGVSEITFSSPSRLRLCFGLCICMRGEEGRGKGGVYRGYLLSNAFWLMKMRLFCFEGESNVEDT